MSVAQANVSQPRRPTVTLGAGRLREDDGGNLLIASVRTFPSSYRL